MPSSVSRGPATMRYGEPGLTRTETIVRRRSYGPPVSAISSGGRRLAASPSSARGCWSNEKMKYDFGLTAPSRLSLSADSSNAIPVRSRSSFSTASGGTPGKRSIRDSTSSVRLIGKPSVTGSSLSLIRRSRSHRLVHETKLGHLVQLPDVTGHFEDRHVPDHLARA